MKFTDIKNKIKGLWAYDDDEFVWTSDEYVWFSSSPDTSSSFRNKNSYFLEFYNDANRNFFRIYDSNGNDVGFIDGNELNGIQVKERFCNLIFNGGGRFMFSYYKP